MVLEQNRANEGEKKAKRIARHYDIAESIITRGFFTAAALSFIVNVGCVITMCLNGSRGEYNPNRPFISQKDFEREEKMRARNVKEAEVLAKTSFYSLLGATGLTFAGMYLNNKIEDIRNARVKKG